jgi:hypothetical protein
VNLQSLATWHLPIFVIENVFTCQTATGNGLAEMNRLMWWLRVEQRLVRDCTSSSNCSETAAMISHNVSKGIRDAHSGTVGKITLDLCCNAKRRINWFCITVGNRKHEDPGLCTDSYAVTKKIGENFRISITNMLRSLDLYDNIDKLV